MARFDKKWMFVHVPAGIAAVCLLAFGVHQCEGKDILRAENKNAMERLKKHNEVQVDSLNTLTVGLLSDKLEHLDSIDALNRHVASLKSKNDSLLNANDSLLNANDSLVVALDDCAKAKKQKAARVLRKEVSKPAKKQLVSGPTVNARGSEKASVRPTTEIRLGKDAMNDGDIIVGNANAVNAQAAQPEQRHCKGAEMQKDVVISVGENSYNSGTIVVGNSNTVYRVLPDTVVRFVKVKNSAVKCRVVSKQRQYR